MPRQPNYKQRFTYLLLLALSLTLLIGGSALEKRGVGHTLATIASEVGLAGLIALILAATFERLFAEEMRRQFAQQRRQLELDVVQHIFRRAIPSTISDAIFDHIFRAPFVRRNLTASYRLEPVDDVRFPGRFVLVTLTMGYEIQNLTREPKLFRLNTGIDPAPVPELEPEVRFLAFTASDPDGQVKISLEGAALLPYHDYAAAPARVRLDLADGILVAPHSKMRIRIKSQMVKHLDRDYDYFVLNHHTCECGITVVAPDTLLVTASGFADHLLREDESHDPAQGHYCWSTTRPLLSQQGLYISWSHQAPAAAPPSSIADPEGAAAAVR